MTTSQTRSKSSRHCTLIAVDISGFCDPHRDDDVQLHLRKVMYEILQSAFPYAAARRRGWQIEDRGDGALIVAPPRVPVQEVIEVLTGHVPAGVRWHNKMASDAATIKLRIAVHAGQVYRDDHGITGHAVQLLFRLLDAPTFKHAVVTSAACVGLVASDYLYEEVISHGVRCRFDPADFTAFEVRNKETATRAWLYLPGGGRRLGCQVPLDYPSRRGGDSPCESFTATRGRRSRAAHRGGRAR